MEISKSISFFERAQAVIPGGVNSPVRAFKNVGGTPRFIEAGDGPYIIDADGNRYIDYVLSWGPLILGHQPRIIREAIISALEHGTCFGAPTELEVEFAELLVGLIPSLDMVRVVSSGTEATMSAVRLARGFTGREYILKFNGCYHGHADFFLVKAGSGVATHGISGSPGVPQAVVGTTLSIEFNDLDLFQDTIRKVGPEKIAAVIIEAVPGNMGLVLPEPGFLQGIRAECSRHGIVLIFDEVMSGFRVAFGGAQERFSVTPDLSTFGKVVGGGMPVGVFGGRREIMAKLAPSGPVYQAGTLSGSPLGMAAGIAMLTHLRERNPYPEFENRGQKWARDFSAAAARHGIALTASACGSMLGFFFSSTPVRNFAEAARSDISMFNSFFHGMLREGVYLAPSAFEAGFLSTLHSEEILDETISAAEHVISEIAAKGR